MVAALGAALVFGSFFSAADADVGNPGTVSFTMTNGTLEIDGAALDVAFSGLSATGSGTVAANGAVDISTLNFPSFAFELLANGGPGTGIPGTASPVATLPWTGTIDPDAGTLAVSGQMFTNVAVPLLGASNCPLGPLSLNLTTGTSGVLTGTPYDKTTGTAKLVENDFAIPALVFNPATAVACPQTVVDLFNQGLPFPIAEGFAKMTFDVAISPAIVGATTTTEAPTTTEEPTTTTTEQVTTTTEEPTTTTTEQVTTTTEEPTTTTEEPTTTTEEPTTTTTEQVTTTTTEQATTTTAQATTTTAASSGSTTTVAGQGATSTTAAGAATTTTVGSGGAAATTTTTVATSNDSTSSALPTTGAGLTVLLAGFALLAIGLGIALAKPRREALTD